MNRFMSSALALLLGFVFSAGAVWATHPIQQQAGASTCTDCHRSALGGVDNPPNLDPDKRARWEKHLSRAGDSPVADVTDVPISGDSLQNPGAPDSSGISIDPQSLSPEGPNLGSSNPQDLPGFDDLGQSGSSDTLVPAGEEGPAAPGDSVSQNRFMEDELIRIDLELKGLEDDIRTYNGLLATARDSSESESLRRTLYAYEAQRRALRQQQKDLARAKQTMATRPTTTGDDSPAAPTDSNDADLASRAFGQAQGNRLKDLEPGTNPLSPESQITNVTRDVVTAVDVAKDMEVQRFIEQLEDKELQERMNSLWSAVRLEPTLQNSFDAVLAAIDKNGGRKCKLSAVREALEKAEAEASRRQVGSDEFEKHFMDKVGRDALTMDQYKNYVQVMCQFDKEHSDPSKLNPKIAQALAQAKTDYAAYQVAIKAFVQDQSKRALFEQAESAFQKHLRSLKLFFKAYAEVTRNGSDLAAVESQNPNPQAPVLENQTTDEPVGLTDTTPEPVTTTRTTPEPTVTTPTTPANPELTAKLQTDLKAFNDEVSRKLAEVERLMSQAWSKSRPWTVSTWFGSEDPRVAQLKSLSQHYFAWENGSNGNVAFVWPQTLQRIYIAAVDGGIDLETDATLSKDYAKARDGAFMAMMLSKLLQGYDGHLKAVEDADVTEAMSRLYINRMGQTPILHLSEVRGTIKTDCWNFRLGIDKLWTTKSLTETKETMKQVMIKLRTENPTTKLEDAQVAFFQYKQALAGGYINRVGGYSVWMSCADSPVYRVVDMAHFYLEKHMWFEAKLAIDELR